MVKKSACNAGDSGSISRSGRSTGVAKELDTTHHPGGTVNGDEISKE